MTASEAFSAALAALSLSTLDLDLGLGAVADVCAITLDEVLSKLIETVEVVTGAGFTHRFESQPAHDITDSIVVALLLAFWVGVVKAQDTLAAVILGESKVNGNSLAVANVEESVGLGRESCADLGDSLGERLFLVDILQETDLEHSIRVPGSSRLLCIGLGSLGGLLLDRLGLILAVLLGLLLCLLLELALGLLVRVGGLSGLLGPLGQINRLSGIHCDE